MISNADDWWSTVDRHWDDLKVLMEQFLPMNAKRDGKCAREIVEELKTKRDAALAEFFEETWAAAPDSPHIHELDGWDTLCELCSESYVLHEEEDDPYVPIDGEEL